jgi:molybdate transport system substrate-binding protein
MSRRALFAFFLLLALLTAQAAPRVLTIAAAADLNFAFPEIAAGFEQKTGQKVRLIFGSSGNFFAQIQNGAPFDLFFSADIEYPRKLAEAGLTEPGTLYRYAVGRIVLWVPEGSKINVAGLEIRALLDPSVQKIAIADPRHAPYGRAAVAAMEQFGVYEEVKHKLVFGENISQTAQFVESGGADIGIIALSLATAPPMKDKGKYWEIPESAHPPIEQAAVILKSSQNKQAAIAFLDYLKSSAGLELMRGYGFSLPAEATKTK